MGCPFERANIYATFELRNIFCNYFFQRVKMVGRFRCCRNTIYGLRPTFVFTPSRVYFTNLHQWVQTFKSSNGLFNLVFVLSVMFESGHHQIHSQYLLHMLLNIRSHFSSRKIVVIFSKWVFNFFSY